ncbi:BTAD domain-containing putative transcriptional regulator [Nocardioides sp. GCM10027113]|uniref:nSTAND1 domain-containing NTPase n=1 Tax=unclassified Nocardioides TaxID=2615069 RepID=UPI0036228A74
MIRFHALGGLAVTDERGGEVGIGGPRQRRLLAMLLIHRDAVVSVDRLADAVFAGVPTPAASTTLRSYVARTRRLIDGEGNGTAVVTRAPGYVLRVPAELFDVACFERSVAEAGASLGRDDPEGAAALLREALALWRGDAYAEFADEDWARPEAQRLQELRLVAQERVVEAELACGRAAEMIPRLEALVREQPLREGFRAQLMTALYRVGRQADALAVFRGYRALLVDELGVEPTPSLAALEQRVLVHDPTLVLAEPATRPLRGYRLGERLGTGRDGTVRAARLPGVERDFAIRVVRREVADHPDFVRTFEATAHRLAALHHPGMVPLHDYWREPGAAYLVMRRMHGGSLADRLQRGPLSDPELQSLVARVGGALATAAAQGIAHGRVGPGSVLLDAGGDFFLADFALAGGASAPDFGSDVSDFAELVRGCLDPSRDRAPVVPVLDRARLTVGRPSMAELVLTLVAGLAGESPATSRVLPNPYKGLRPFAEADAEDFFGRTDLVQAILDRLREDGPRGRFVLVVGGSGSGKSSAVRAGVLPRVRHGDVPGSRQWFVTTMLPGTSPFRELAESLRRVAVVDTVGLPELLAEDVEGVDRVLRRLLPEGGQLLLVADQLEELFTLAGPQEQRAFLAGVMHAVTAVDSRLRVVATLRADFYDRPLGDQTLGPLVSEATVTVVAMTAADLEAAIVEPLERVGGSIEAPLVAELVGAAVDESAPLPALQYTLYELAERNPSRRLELAAYRELGGVGGAVATRAERLYAELDDAEQAAVRRMFERLVVVGAEGEPARRRAARAELSGLAGDAVIDRWAKARLLTLDRDPRSRVPTVELAHEALLREWPRLRSWIEEDREAILALDRLREAAAAWLELDRDPGALWRGARLDLVLENTAVADTDLPRPEHEFLEASREARDRERREDERRAARQVLANRRLRRQRATIAGALAVALVGGFVALDQRDEAEGERRVAMARELAAAAVTSMPADPQRSILLALAAVDETRSHGEPALPEAVEALHGAVAGSRVLRSFPAVGGGLDWSPSGAVFATEGPEESGLVEIRDARTGEPVHSFRGHDDDVNDVSFSEDGSMLATSGDDGSVRVWRADTGREVLTVRHPGGPVVDDVAVWSPSFSADGGRLAAGWPDGVRVVDVDSGRVVAEIAADRPMGIALSPDGRRVAFGGGGGATATVASVATGEVLLRLGRDDPPTDLAWSPDGRWIAVPGSRGSVAVWDAGTGELAAVFPGSADHVWEVDWSPDGTRLAAVGDDGTAHVSEVGGGGGRPLIVLSAPDSSRGGGMNGVAFSPDGRRLMTGDLAITSVTVWDVDTTGGGEWASVEGGVGFTADGDGLLVVGRDGAVSEVSADDGSHLADVRDGPAEVWWSEPSPDGALLALLGPRGVTVVDAATGAERFVLPWRGADWVRDLEWSPAGDHLAVAFTSFDRRRPAVVVDTSGVELARLLEKAGNDVGSLAFSPDGRLLATTRLGVAKVDPTQMPVTLWDWERETVVGSIDATAASVVFDPTGNLLATTRLAEGVVDVWEVGTGRLAASLTGSAPVLGLAFDAAGTRLASAHADGTIRLWDPRAGTRALVLGADDDPIERVSFSPDGSRLLSVGESGLARVWALDLDDLVDLAHGRLTRGLTEDECRRFLHRDRCPAA